MGSAFCNAPTTEPDVGQILKYISVTPPRDWITKFLRQREPVRSQG